MKALKIYGIIILKIFGSLAVPILAFIAIGELVLGIHPSWRYLLFLTLTMSIVGAHHYRETAVKTSIEDKDSFIIDFKEKLDYSLWRIISENEECLVLQPKFDRPYSWMYKERVSLSIVEKTVELKGSKLYVDRVKAIIENESWVWDKKSVRYVTKTILVLMILIPILMHVGIIDIIGLKQTYHEYKVRGIEKISFQENYIMGNSENNTNNYGIVAANEDYIFHVKDNSSIYRTDKNFDNEVKLVIESSGTGIWYLNIIEDWLFYREGKAIKRIKIDGSEKDTIFNLGYALDIHLLDNWLYFTSFHDGFKLYKMTVNGENLEKIVDISVSDIAIYDNKLYYSYTSGGIDYLKSMDLNSQEEKLVANLHVMNMIIEDNLIYYINYNDNKLYQQDLSNNQTKSLLEDEITQFLKTEDYIYFMGKGEDGFHPGKGLYKISLNDSSIEMIHDNWFMQKINIIDDWILYISSSKDKQSPSLKRIHIEDSMPIEMDSGY